MRAGHRVAVPRKWLVMPVIGWAAMVAIFILISYAIPGHRPVHGEGGLQLLIIDG
jgi:hypothetical protein